MPHDFKIPLRSSGLLYADSSGNLLPTFWDNLPTPSFFFGFLTLDDGTDNLPRNVGKELPLLSV
jgi:hypothetical protein